MQYFQVEVIILLSDLLSDKVIAEVPRRVLEFIVEAR